MAKKIVVKWEELAFTKHVWGKVSREGNIPSCGGGEQQTASREGKIKVFTGTTNR